ncbi:E3 ubiquitin protein ligase DRIP2-like isoform X2 [Chenopodium quinoa]|uniref:E3 ubiquitin protein ligase DRIP2-like isoform X2 n=1 Tax=Chenopodium quinoa TaxID=63459 RepID=UPI000B78543E|nr:E3 ubiquitin protein ligase DRIP2-like isoform X2 [Chenopodium quinoa]
MASQLVVQVRRDKLEACMTCPLCKQLLREATTISLCLHTFCRKCIYDKLSDEDVDCCPVCDVNLGIVPEEKLRPDHNLQDIIAKIFPANGRKVEEPEVAPPVSPPAKRKERSLSSLVVSTPRVSMQAGVTGRRTRAGVRKGSAPRGASPATEETPKKEEDSMEDCVDGSSSPETLNKIIQNKKQSSSAKSSNDQNRGEHLENSNEDSSCSGDADISMNKTRNEENEQRDEGQDEKNAVPTVPGPAKRKRLRPSNRNRSSAPAEQSSPQVVVNEVRRNWKDGPIWFTLVASEDQEGGEPLPQIPAAFLRVKDGNMPISSIQKYIVKKLDLASEAEVQILLQGQPVQPDLLLSSLLEAWLHASPTQNKIQTVVGDSAKEFVMVISYARKVEAPTA